MRGITTSSRTGRLAASAHARGRRTGIAPVIAGLVLWCASASTPAQNMVTNGDFSSVSPLGFSSDYILTPGLTNATGSAGRRRFDVAPAPSASASWGGACASVTGTPGTGNVVLANGHTIASRRLVYQTLTGVVSGTVYAWSFKAASLATSSAPSVRMTLAGTNLMSATSLGTTPCAWQTFAGKVTPGSSGNLDLAIYDDTIADAGNDFMVDDLVFAPLTVTVGAAGASAVSVDTQQTYTFTVTNGSGVFVGGQSIAVVLPVIFSGTYDWTCGSGTNGGTCGTASGTSGARSFSVSGISLPAGATVTVTVTGMIGSTGSGTVQATSDSGHVGSVAVTAAYGIDFRCAATYATGTTSLAANLSTCAGLRDGDMMIAVINQAGAVNTITPPAGWTQSVPGSHPSAPAARATQINQHIFYRKKTAADGPTVTFTSDSASPAGLQIVAYSGVGSAAPVPPDRRSADWSGGACGETYTRRGGQLLEVGATGVCATTGQTKIRAKGHEALNALARPVVAVGARHSSSTTPTVTAATNVGSRTQRALGINTAAGGVWTWVGDTTLAAAGSTGHTEAYAIPQPTTYVGEQILLCTGSLNCGTAYDQWITVSPSVDGPDQLMVGGTGTYTVTYANTGPSSASVGISFDIPTMFAVGWTATCNATGGAICPNVSGGGAHHGRSGSFLPALLPNGGAVTISFALTAESTGSGSISATAVAVSYGNHGTGTGSKVVTVDPASTITGFTAALANAGLTCRPATVTITPVGGTPYANMQTTLAALFAGNGAAHGDFACPAGGCVGFTLAPGAADGGTATITWSAGTTSAVLEYRNTWAETVKLRAASTTPAVSGESALTAFAHAGLRFTDAAGSTNSPFSTLVAGTASGTLYVQAVQSTSCSGPTCTGSCAASPYYSGARALDFRVNCANPTTCAGSNATVNATSFGTGTGASSAWAPVTLTFGTNGGLAASAPITFGYADVGQVTLEVRDTATPGSPSGLSNAFVVRPADLRVTAVTRTADAFANPAAADANGTVFARAGESFTVAVQAETSAGAAAPNFGREASPATVTLDRALVAPAGGNNPALTGTLGAFSAGQASGAFTWPEVGIIRLTASVADYLGTGAITGTQSGNVGRFRPDRFVVTNASGKTFSLQTRPLGMVGTGAYLYFGEPVYLEFKVLSRALGGAQTLQNYTGAFNKLAAVPASFNVALRDTLTGTSLTGRIGAATVDGSSGYGVHQMVVPITHPGPTPEGPYDAVAIGVAPVDADGTAVAPADFNMSSTGGANDRVRVGPNTKIRYGRLRLVAGGAQPVVNPITLTVQAQYWLSGAGNWAVNDLDYHTSISPQNFAMSGYAGNLAAGETRIASVGGGAPPSSLDLSTGTASFQLTAPGLGNTGSVSVRFARNTPGSGSPEVYLYGGAGAVATLGAGWAFDGSTAVDPSITAQWSNNARAAKKRFHIRENR